MSTPLEKKLRNRLSVGEKIRLDHFMYAALLDVECGYYSIQRVFGKEGDFITAPDISQIFGEVIAAYVAANIAKCKKDHIAVVELGPGRATLASDMLRALKRMPEDHQPEEVIMCEASEKLVATQRDKLNQSTIKTDWIQHITDLPDKTCFILANEFFDALPIRQLQYNQNGWQERYIGLNNDRLILTSQDCEPSGEEQQLINATSKANGPCKPGNILEYPESGTAMMQTIADHLVKHNGMMIAIDYGYMDYAFGDTLQAVKQHQYVDILSDVGESDISAHVNFAWMQHIAEAAGLRTELLTTQGAFLRKLGAELRAAKLCENATDEQQQDILSGLHRIMAPDQMGELFKVLIVASNDMELENIGW